MASGQWQLHTEKAAATLGAADGHSATVGHANRADDGQSQPGPTHLTRASLVGALDAFKDMRQIISRNAQPRIRDFEYRMTVSLHHSDGYLSPAARSLNPLAVELP